MNQENTTETPSPKSEVITQDAKTFGMLCHLLAFAGFKIP
jgi:hypothetical protein